MKKTISERLAVDQLENDYERLNQEQKGSEKDPFTEERYQQFFRCFPDKARRILDVGCNTGRGGAVLRRFNPELYLVGLDCLQERLQRLPLGVYNDRIQGYSTAIDALDDSFDVICAGEFIEHLKINDVEQTLHEFWRVLKSGGTLLITTPNPDYLRLKLTGGSVLGGAHLSQHRVKDLTRTLQGVGFVEIRIKGSGKVSRYLGQNFPLLSFYGSYLVSAEKKQCSFPKILTGAALPILRNGNCFGENYCGSERI